MNWIIELKIEKCMTEESVGCVDFGIMNPEPMMIIYVTEVIIIETNRDKPYV
jgi:hypothetical protein